MSDSNRTPAIDRGRSGMDGPLAEWVPVSERGRTGRELEGLPADSTPFSERARKSREAEAQFRQEFSRTPMEPRALVDTAGDLLRRQGIAEGEWIGGLRARMETEVNRYKAAGFSRVPERAARFVQNTLEKLETAMQWKLESLKEDLDLPWLHRKFDSEMEKPDPKTDRPPLYAGDYVVLVHGAEVYRSTSQMHALARYAEEMRAHPGEPVRFLTPDKKGFRPTVRGRGLAGARERSR